VRSGQTLLFLAGLVLAGCATAHVEPAVHEARDDERVAVDAALDGFHAAASRADGERYFGYLAPGSVFVGTDATERWEREAFRAYAEPYFSQGRGWTFRPIERHVYVRGDCAWFDERLASEKYGETRGSGVLVRAADGWRIVQYVLSFPIPNDLSSSVVELIRAGAKPSGSGGS
jgi:ketosteroid isomerase-like protein